MYLEKDEKQNNVIRKGIKKKGGKKQSINLKAGGGSFVTSGTVDCGNTTRKKIPRYAYHFRSPI